MMELSQFLNEQRPFSDLKAESIDFISKKFHKREYMKDQAIIRKGEMADGLGIVAFGKLNALFNNSNCTRTNNHHILANEFYNDISLVSCTSSDMDIFAEESTTCFVLPAKDFYSISKSFNIIDDFFQCIVNTKILSILKKQSIFNHQLNQSFDSNNNDCCYPSYICKALNYIDENFSQSISLDHLSSICGVSKHHLSRTFKEHIGVTFVLYLNKKRINEAKRMMHQLRANVTDTCYAVGFNDLSHFSRSFKKFEKISPSKYRKSILRE